MYHSIIYVKTVSQLTHTHTHTRNTGFVNKATNGFQLFVVLSCNLLVLLKLS